MHPAQLEEVPGAHRLPAAPSQSGAPAVCLAQQAGPQGAAQEEVLTERGWQAAAGLLCFFFFFFVFFLWGGRAIHYVHATKENTSF